MDITELEQYNLKDAVRLNQDLNPALFANERLKPDVRKALLRIADDFREYLGLSDAQIDDITISGSNAGYTYTPYSDIDLHLIIDMSRLKNDEVYRELFDAKKSLYNDRHDIQVKDYDVEVYVQGAADQHHSRGVYSVKNDDWLRMPNRQKMALDDNAVQSKYKKLGQAIEQAIKNPDYEKLDLLFNKIKRMRQAGLDRAGEFSAENLAFKLLRNRGLIKQLVTARDRAKSQELSIEEAAYAGNIGIMELNEFYRRASQEQKRLLAKLIRQGSQRAVWDLIKRVTGMEIMTEFRWGFADEPLQEAASGYIPSEAEKDDPRFSNALTVDIKPDSLKKSARQLGFKISRAGVPPRARTNGSLTEGRVSFRGVDSRLTAEINRAIPAILNSLQLKPTEIPPVTFTSDRSWARDHNTFGVTQWQNTADDSQVYVYVGDRYLADVLRTYTHELQHVKQFINGIAHHDMNSQEHAAVEADANTVAGRIVHDYGKRHDEIFTDIAESFGRFKLGQPINEDQDLFEVKMSPSELERWARSPEAEGIQAGFEAELIFRNTASEDNEESEPDMDADERAYSVQQVADFFRGGEYGITSRTAERLESGLYEEYYDWANETVDSEWNEQESKLVREWILENISPTDYRQRAAEDLDIDSDEPTAEQMAAIDQRAQELLDDDVETAVNDRNDTWQSAYDEFSDERRDESDLDEEAFFRDRYRYMSDVGDAYSLDWPYWTSGSYNRGGRTTDDIANSLSSELGGAEVRASSGYHSTSRKPGRWIIEPDGSLSPDDSDDAGLEVVSPPMPLPDALAALRDVIDWANSEDGDAYTNDSTGLHMGVSIPYKGGDVDYVKLIMFMGDQYVLDQFGRAANSYTRSALNKLKDVQRSRRSTNEAQGLSGAEKTAAAMDLMRKNLIELAQRYVQDGVGKDKYTSAHIKPGYIEFRSPGGDYLSMDNRDESALANTMLRFARAMYIAGRPDLERKEYSKKLYKLLSGFKSAEISKPSSDTKYKTKIETEGDNDALELFARYSTGQITPEELKKDWARRVLAKEQPKKAEQEYEVYDKDTGETLETMRFARGDEGMVSAAIADVIEKYSGQGINYGLRLAGEPEVEISRRAKVAKKIAERPTVWTVSVGDKNIQVMARDTEEAKQRARDRDDYFNRNRSYLSVRPATAEEIKQYQAQAQDNTQDTDDVEQRVTGPSQEQRYIVQWTEQRNGREVSDSLRVTARNADAAMDQVRGALEAQGRRPTTISADTAPIPGSTLDLAQQRAQQAAAGAQQQYEIYDANTRDTVVGFMAASDEEALARLERYRASHPGQQFGVRTGDITSRTRAAQPQGEWTGHWVVKDAQGRELTRFHGIGNNQSDANRHAARWLGTNRPDLAGQEIEVVPEMR